MANVRVSRSLSPNSQFGRDVARVAATEVARRMNAVGEAAVVEADAIVSATYANERSPDRRRTGAKLLGSFRYKVVWDHVGFPVAIELRSIAEGAKVNSLNQGSKAHTIAGPSVFPVAQVFGKGNVVKAGKFTAAYVRNAPGASNPRVKATGIDHPGTSGAHFLEKALERAVQNAYQQAVAARMIRS